LIILDAREASCLLSAVQIKGVNTIGYLKFDNGRANHAKEMYSCLVDTTAL
jgi:hypothetical protein